MLKTFSNRTCAFDCEWVPCASTARRLLGLHEEMCEREVFEAVWSHYAKPGAEDERPYLKLVLCKVISIAGVFRAVDQGGHIDLNLRSRGIDSSTEGEMIRAFLETVAAQGLDQKYQLWGFNSSNADIPILKQRAVALGVACPRFSERPNKPWEGLDYHDARNSDAHMDILGILGAYDRAAKPSLHELAIACGLPGKLDAGGSQVADLLLAGRVADIVEYNELDAFTTHLIMLRIAFHAGKLNSVQFAGELDAARTLAQNEADKGKAQWARYLAAWDQQVASGKPLVPAGRSLDAALVLQM